MRARIEEELGVLWSAVTCYPSCVSLYFFFFLFSPFFFFSFLFFSLPFTSLYPKATTSSSEAP